MDLLQSFYIPPAGVNPMGIAKLRPMQGLSKGTIKLVVIAGGPVFLWEDDKSAQAAYDLTHGAKGDVDFDLAASATGASELKKESFPSLMTVASDEETIGFVMFSEAN